MTQNKTDIKPEEEIKESVSGDLSEKQNKDADKVKSVSEKPEVKESIPAKFIDAKTGEVNWDALVKSYLALEKKMSTREPVPAESAGMRPSSPDGYQIDLKSDLMNIDADVNKRLFDLGFTNEQVQAVYDLAAEKVIPMIQQLSLDYKADRELADLEQEFGGPERFNAVARQLSAWGEKNLDGNLFQVLASNKEGIRALYKMMCSKQESPVLPQQGIQQPIDSEETLRRLMQSPKYWKQQDPELVKRIEDGFKRLYG